MKEFNIPIFRLSYDDDFKKKFHKGCEQILDEAFLSNHTMVKKFEEDFMHFNNSKYCIGTSSGTSALEVALRACEVESGEVLIQTNTFIATAVAVKNAGAKIGLIDIEKEFYGLCPKSLKQSINSNTKAVVIVHIGGNITPHIEEIVKLCEEKGVTLIEDCAHAHGSSYKGVMAGNFGRVGCYSFFTTKTMAMGEGGAIVSNDEALFNTMKSIRQFGFDLNNNISHTNQGSNFKMNEFSALMGILELERAKGRIEKRQLIAKRYSDNLKRSNWKVLLPENQSISGHYKTMILSPVNREILEKFFSDANIAITGGVYKIPLHRQPIIKSNLSESDFRNSDYFSDNHFCPPCYPEMTFQEVDYITDKMLELHL
jgi:dTDP-4-amino-4,6-dideoxygalactose transaminase